MKTRNILVISMTLALLVGLFIAISIAMAADPRPCGQSFPPPDSDGTISVKKTVYCEKATDWTWDILKTADETDLTLTPGQSHDVNYTVELSATSSDTSFAVSGLIQVVNLSSAMVEDVTLTDSLPVSLSCMIGAVPVASFPVDIPATSTMECTFSGGLSSAATSNVATASYSGGDVIAEAPIDWSLAVTTETDECVDVVDDQYGPLGTVCAGDADKTFNYTQTVGPFEVCGPYEFVNIASFETNDNGETGSSSWTVDINVPCEGGCSLTPGYWKTHSTFGPAPYDDTWALLLPSGENSPFFFSGVTYYQALWTSPQGNAYWILAHAYIAAKLNQLNGADFTAAQAAFNSATLLFSNPTYTPAFIGSLRGNNPIRQSFIAYATILDDYNNGLIGPGHCSE